MSHAPNKKISKKKEALEKVYNRLGTKVSSHLLEKIHVNSTDKEQTPSKGSER